MAIRVLVTGASGFIGSHLCEMLIEEGFNVRAFIHYNSFGRLGWLDVSGIQNEIEVYSGDIRDFDSVSRACKAVDLVLHLASLIGIPYSYHSPLAYIKTNVEGTYNVLQACLEHDVERIIHTSTSEVYGTAQYVPIDEAHPLQPQSPYSASKIAADQMVLSFHYSFDLPVVIARPSNTFGPRQSARAVIPTIIIQFLAGSRVIQLGNLSPTRDLTYVLDTARGFYSLAMTELGTVVGKVINIGNGKEISIGELVQRIANIIGLGDIEVEQKEERLRKKSSEVERLLSDSTQMKSLTGWHSKYTLDQGLKLTIQWFEKHMNFYRTGVYCV